MHTGKYTPFFFILPMLATMVIISIYPFIFSLTASFTAYNIIKPELGWKIVGLDNYIAAFQSSDFLSSLKISIHFVTFAVLIEFTLGMVLAVILNQNYRGFQVIRSLLILPMAISSIAAGLIFNIELNAAIGIIPYLFSLVGITNFIPLSDPNQAIWMIIAIDVWQWTPLIMLILVAGLKSIPSEQFEAAAVDGASATKIFRHITLPNLKFVMGVALLLRTMDAFKLFDLIYILTGGGPASSTQVVSYWIYKVGLSFFEIGRASALSYILVGIIIFISIIYVRLFIRKEG